jgi:hypothetical protein
VDQNVIAKEKRMFNTKILEVLDHGDMLIQKTTGGAVVHFIDENAEKRDENGQLDPWAVRSFAYDFDLAEHRYLENLLDIVADKLCVEANIRVAKNWDAHLEDVIAQALEWENELVEVLKKHGYEIKKIEGSCSEK